MIQGSNQLPTIEVLYEDNHNLEGEENQIHVLSISSFQNLNKNTALSLYMHTNNNTVNVASVAFNM